MLLTNLNPDVMRWSPMCSDMYIVHCSIICYIDMLATLFIHLHICCIILSAISRIWCAYLRTRCSSNSIYMYKDQC